MQISHQIISVSSEEAESTLLEEYKQQEGNLLKALIKFKSMSKIKQLFLYPNFQFRWLAPPSGWVAQLSALDKFKKNPFCSEKFRMFTMVKLQFDSSQDTPKKKEEIEQILRKRFSTTAVFPPSLTNNVSFGAALGDRGCSIGIMKATIKTSSEPKTIYFVISHVSLPDEFIDELQERDHLIHESGVEFDNNNGNVRQELLTKAQAQSYEQEFCDSNGVYTQVLLMAKEYSKRVIYYWSKLVDIPLDVEILANPIDLEPDDNTPEPSGKLLPLALETWGAHFICPFSCFPSEGVEPAVLKNYRIGHALYLLKKKLPKEFEEAKKVYKFTYDPSIANFTPAVQTPYNTFKCFGTNQIYWYDCCTPIDSEPFLVHKGLEFGFDCYNYNPLTGQRYHSTVHNEFGNGFPVIFPFKRDPYREVSKDIILKFFSVDAGGQTMHYKQPEQFQGRFINTTAFNTTKLYPQLEKFELEPVHVFLSKGYTNIPLYNI